MFMFYFCVFSLLISSMRRECFFLAASPFSSFLWFAIYCYFCHCHRKKKFFIECDFHFISFFEMKMIETANGARQSTIKRSFCSVFFQPEKWNELCENIKFMVIKLWSENNAPKMMGFRPKERSTFAIMLVVVRLSFRSLIVYFRHQIMATLKRLDTSQHQQLS